MSFFGLSHHKIRFENQIFEISIFLKKNGFENFSALEWVFFEKTYFFILSALERVFFRSKIFKTMGLPWNLFLISVYEKSQKSL